MFQGASKSIQTGFHKRPGYHQGRYATHPAAGFKAQAIDGPAGWAGHVYRRYRAQASFQAITLAPDSDADGMVAVAAFKIESNF
jgi:hypothetical protein